MCLLFWKGDDHVLDCTYDSYVSLLSYLDIQQGQSGCMDDDGTKWQIICDHHLLLSLIPVLSKGSSAVQGPCLPHALAVGHTGLGFTRWWRSLHPCSLLAAAGG